MIIDVKEIVPLVKKSKIEGVIKNEKVNVFLN
jgi:hypothetical protein